MSQWKYLKKENQKKKQQQEQTESTLTTSHNYLKNIQKLRRENKDNC